MSKRSWRIFFFFLTSLLFATTAPPVTPKTTDLSEATSLKSIFHDWENSSPFFSIRWDRSTSNLCNTSATANGTACSLSNVPLMRCDCTFDNGTTCHVVELNAADCEIEKGFPEELRNLTKLRVLNLNGNYFTGNLPPFVGNMKDLNTLDLGSNLLDGAIPIELGNLTNLEYLDISINKFNGSLPPALGNLTNLQHLRLNSIRVNGPIPSAFDKLKKLQTLWMSDVAFTGKVPEFIGSFIHLSDLRLHGNSFQGPIPSNFSYLTNLTDLRIGEVNGSSTLLDIKNMRSLEILILRNCNISGSIPSDFGSNTRLKHLDLSFNRLTGPVPQSLFDIQTLGYLALGNNYLSGTLPSHKNASCFIDLSYNEFSGSFPSWVNGSYNLNLVANYFTDDTGASDLSQLVCLQRNFTCSQNPSSFNYKFAINSGGSKSVNASDTADPIYQSDGAALEEVPYNIITNDDGKWAVSSVGRFLDVTGPNYIQSIQSVFEGTQTPDLYLDMRLSASSLRYYGLGLGKGNYTVVLYFGETQDYWDIRKGRRLFDIYIQGIPVAQDFDITAKANESPKTAVAFNYNTTIVGDNHVLDIHLFWAGKGTCCVPNKMSYGPTIAAVLVKADFPIPTASKAKSKVALAAGTSAAAAFLVMLSIMWFIIWRRRRLEQDEEFLALTIKPKLFSYEELKTATGDFDQANKLGQGGFGSVFKGTLSDGSDVAVKQLSVSSTEGKIQFVTEVATVSTVKHRNLVTLLGCCCEDKKRLLVYEYLINKSLDKILFGKMSLHLDWAARFKICLGTARGLAYLHEESSIRIIHRDVKASNILLDADLNPKISDFGLAKTYDEKMSHISTRVAGTIGYLAPEYAMRGQLTEKADVFGFGIVAFEILTGKSNTEEGEGADKIYLLDWVWQLHEKNLDLGMLDHTLLSYNQEEALRVIKVAFMCTQASATKRPTMTSVVSMLIGDMETVEVKNKPSYLMDWRYCDKFSVSSSYVTGNNFTSPSRLLDTIEEGR